MRINSPQEALYIATEMERRAMQIYERALFLLMEQGREKDPLYATIQSVRAEEHSHLQWFSSLYTGLGKPLERKLTLAAVSNGVFFQGGLMEAAREGLLEDVPSMLSYASGEEARATKEYLSFAGQCEDAKVRTMLERIAAEEEKHLRELENRREEWM